MVSTHDDNCASPQPARITRRNGRTCPRCKRFGTFAPSSLVCDRCAGTLPLGFTVSVTIVVGGGR